MFFYRNYPQINEVGNPFTWLLMSWTFLHQPAASSQASRKKLEAVFGSSADETDSSLPKRKLVPLDYEEENKSADQQEAEDKKKTIKSLIERIPTAKDELFAYTLDWTQVDEVRGLFLRLLFKHFSSRAVLDSRVSTWCGIRESDNEWLFCRTWCKYIRCSSNSSSSTRYIPYCLDAVFNTQSCVRFKEASGCVRVSRPVMDAGSSNRPLV